MFRSGFVALSVLLSGGALAQDAKIAQMAEDCTRVGGMGQPYCDCFASGAFNGLTGRDHTILSHAMAAASSESDLDRRLKEDGFGMLGYMALGGVVTECQKATGVRSPAPPPRAATPPPGVTGTPQP